MRYVLRKFVNSPNDPVYLMDDGTSETSKLSEAARYPYMVACAMQRAEWYEEYGVVNERVAQLEFDQCMAKINHLS